ncbi:ATP-binding protein [Acrocarpospora catenulata]|uniref:ATP-binding protein n=1 Tax=Acrocarpospora catenulata TaxID=2836182 RepID=UPI001BDA628E|nr:ATP-binding protein [Acrocarpospora catenulata]
MTLPFATVALDPGPTRTAECLLPAVGSSVRGARALVHRELARWGADALVDDCAVIVSELVTNVVRHAGTAFALRLCSNGRWVYGEIFDTGDGVPRQRDPGPDATDGRGLMIVSTLSDDWGVASSLRGKIVWFILGTGFDSRPQVAAV